MNARDVIGDLVAKVYSGAPFPSKRSLDRAIDVLDALEAAGYRILGPDELDPVTVDRCKDAAYNGPHYLSSDFPKTDDEGQHRPGSPYDAGRYDARKAIRSLSPTQPEAKEARDGR